MKWVNKLWGIEIVLFNRRYCVKLMLVGEGTNSSMHYHPVKDEVFICLVGKPWVLIRDVMTKYEMLSFGKRIRIKPNWRHQFGCKYGNAIMLELSTFDMAEDTVRLTSSEMRISS